MINLHSQRFKITLIIFGLVTLITGALAWSIIATARTGEEHRILAREDVFLELINSTCHTALITNELDEAQLFIQKLTNNPYIDHIILANHSNRIVASSSFAQVGEPFEPDKLTGKTWRFSPITSQNERIGMLAVKFSHKELAASIKTLLNHALLLTIPGLIAIASVAWLMATLLSRRLEALATTAREISAGDLSVKANESGDDEIGHLAQAFNEMTSVLTNTLEALRSSEHRYWHFSSLTSDFVHYCTRQGNDPYRIQWLGGAIEAITGYSEEEILARGCWLPYLHADDVDRVNESLMRLAPGQTATEQFRVITRSGVTRWLQFRSHCEASSLQDELVLYGAAQDITEQKQAEEEIRLLTSNLEQIVQQRTSQLQGAINDIESFNYAVSHDLRAPLRHMVGYSRMLLDNYREKLDADGVTCLERIEHAGNRMGHLIDTLLRLSRISRAKLNLQPVDMSQMAAEIFAELQKSAPDRTVQLDIAAGLTAVGDSLLIRLMLQNLLGNAWKFTRKASPAIISFFAEEQDGKRSFCVRDNGAGFDMAYADKLFGTFQRLHSDQEFEGAGIGLATVQRIIHRHGGEIKGEAKPGKGATFCFTLG